MIARVVSLVLDLLTAEDRKAELLRVKVRRAKRLVMDAARHAQEAEWELEAHRTRAAAADAVQARQRADALRAQEQYEERAKLDSKGGWA